MAYHTKKEDDTDSVVKVDRTSVFQEARTFSSSPISPRKCRILLTKIALLLSTGERFPRNEATELFFGISKLFQSKDPSLRQMMYLVIKDLAPDADDVLMVTSSIMRDTAASDSIYRANAIRALCRIIDSSTVPAIERLIKTAIVDKTPSVSSAALVSSYHLLPVARDVVRRWQSETQEAASAAKGGSGFSLGFGTSSNSALTASTNHIPQYHAIALLYAMRSNDRMALVKMVQQYSAAGVVKSAPATVLLVRLAAYLADDGLRKPMVSLLEGFTRHKSEMVNFEACKAICGLSDLQDSEVVSVVHVLQLFLSSPRNVTKFAAIRILHQLSSIKPEAIRPINPDIESLIASSNRSIATFAITVLLKTGNESSVDRLLKQISTFMSEISDEFKVVIVEACRTLCLKFPTKQAAMLTFLSGILRDEGGYDFKRSVVDALFDIVRFGELERKEEALGSMSEFIEDCEYTKLSVRILRMLGSEGPKCKHPSRFIRYIYNRLLLENAVVRAAAVNALARYGVGQKDEHIKRSIRVLLTRCLDDTDDEVRDRAALNLRLMDDEDQAMATKFITNDEMYSLPALEHALVMYVTSDGRDTFSHSFDLSQIPVVTREQMDAEDRTKKLTSATIPAPSLKAPKAGPTTKPSGTATEATTQAATRAAQEKYAQQLAQIPELKEYGSVLKSSDVVELTESETEYVVTAIKHLFKGHVVLQYEIRNTLPEVVLADVSVAATPAEDEEPVLEEDFIIPCPEIKSESPGTVYVSFKNAGGESAYAATSFTNVLKFTSKEIDPTTGEPEDTGYEDEYQVEDLELNGADYILPAFAGSFDNVWEQSAGGDSATETLQLSSVKSIADATEQLAKSLSLQPLEGTDVALSNSTHTLKLFGRTVNGGKVAATVRMAFSAKTGVTMKIDARSEEPGVASLVVASVS